MNICEAMGMSISHFESILKMTQRELKEHLVQQLRAHDYEPVCKSGFLYAEGTAPVLLVAHLDTVHTHRPDIILLIKKLRDYSFPSGHAAASFAAASALAFSYCRHWRPAVVLAVLISLSRLYLYVHYPSDVLCGALLGILCGLIGAFWSKKVVKKCRKTTK